MTDITVIGAGNGGLTTAVMLARAGFDVTVLEAHSYPGGCAGTFRRKHYRFDAGATLAGGFNDNEVMDIIAKRVGINDWNARSSEPAMSVHLPSKISVPRYGDERRWEVREKYFGETTIPFWKWQERTADALWDFAKRSPPFPPQDKNEIMNLLKTGVSWFGKHLMNNLSPSMIKDAFSPLATRIYDYEEDFRLFIDSQVLISAQTLARYANALYSASALDLPRRGVVHLEGGIGSIARKLEQALVDNGGTIEYRQRVKYIQEQASNVYVRTSKGKEYFTDFIVANLTPWNLRDLIPKPTQPKVLKTLPQLPDKGWGAFMIYIGIEDKYIQNQTPLHHQIIADGKMTEGNSIFVSISPKWDSSRAPSGKRAITISTHTNLKQWWRFFHHDKSKYDSIKQQYTQKMINLAQQVIPNIKHADLIEAGTPVTFNHFTHRKYGWVGGFRQTNLFQTFGPKLTDKMWLVGDSIFPGQSTAAVSLGGLRVAKTILNHIH